MLLIPSSVSTNNNKQTNKKIEILRDILYSEGSGTTLQYNYYRFLLQFNMY